MSLISDFNSMTYALCGLFSFIKLDSPNDFKLYFCSCIDVRSCPMPCYEYRPAMTSSVRHVQSLGSGCDTLPYK